MTKEIKPLSKLQDAIFNEAEMLVRGDVAGRGSFEQAIEDYCRERVALWMLQNSLTTGHGDTVDDLLSQIPDRQIAALTPGQKGDALRCATPESDDIAEFFRKRIGWRAMENTAAEAVRDWLEHMGAAQAARLTPEPGKDTVEACKHWYQTTPEFTDEALAIFVTQREDAALERAALDCNQQADSNAYSAEPLVAGIHDGFRKAARRIRSLKSSTTQQTKGRE